MDLVIKWTKRAEINFDKTVQYIETEWGEKSAKKFVVKVSRLLTILKTYPEIGKIEIPEKGIRSFVFSRQNTVFYRIKGESIIVLSIFDNRKDPKSRLI